MLAQVDVSINNENREKCWLRGNSVVKEIAGLFDYQVNYND